MYHLRFVQRLKPVDNLTKLALATGREWARLKWINVLSVSICWVTLNFKKIALVAEKNILKSSQEINF